MAKIAFLLLILPLFSQAFAPKSFSFDYVQNGKDKGQLDFQSPDRIKMMLSTDEVIYLTSKSGIKYTPPMDPKEKGSVYRFSKIDDPLFFLMTSLVEGIKSNAVYDAKTEANKIVLTLKAKDSLNKEIQLEGKNLSSDPKLSNVTDIVIFKKDGRKSHFKVSNFQEKTFPKDYFEFTPPKNTKFTDL